MSVHADDWLAGILGYPVFRIAVDSQAAPGWIDREVVPHIAARSSRTMYYTKVDTADITTVRALSALGLYVVDVNVTLGIEARDTIPASRPARGVDVFECDDEASGLAAMDIAGSAMRFSRFHLDPAVPVEIAHRIKRDWIHSYVRHLRGDVLLVARAGGRIVGFNAILSSVSHGARVSTIDLIAVDPSSQRQGAGRALTAAFIDRYRATSDLLRVGTQAANIPSMRLYEAMGFSIRQTTYVMHLHTHSRAA